MKNAFLVITGQPAAQNYTVDARELLWRHRVNFVILLPHKVKTICRITIAFRALLPAVNGGLRFDMKRSVRIRSATLK